ncbi:MAG: Gfo/Idh/MocA family oxidoreductase [Phycisphaerae bacterium]|nr:Gfo/Idh/MocA family oxidoreductase [Phycisphaerae bacterium]
MTIESLTGDAVTRRVFVKSSAAAFGTMASVGGSLMTVPAVWGSVRADDRIRVGLVGCGGRGSGAVRQALDADKGAVLWAIGDMFADKIDGCLRGLRDASEQPDGSMAASAYAERLDVPAERQFSGFDCADRLIASGVDVVLLCTPPHFRPMQLAAAVKAKKHVFCEKPMAVDATGVRMVIESAKTAKEQGTSLMSGFCWRYSLPERAVYGKILAGDIGRVRSVHATYHTSPIWTRTREPGWTDMEFQLRNWPHFLWLGGDHIVEQACHSIDKINWAMNNLPPVRVTTLGGRAMREGAEHGNAYDHFAVIYEYADGARAFLTTRQQHHCSNENKDWVACEQGTCFINGWAPQETRIEGATPWTYSGPTSDMYQQEHNELFAAIRAGAVLNDGHFMAQSTLMAIAGREACYSGQTLTWEQMLKSTQHLVPPSYDMKAEPPAPVVPMPGKYRFV